MRALVTLTLLAAACSSGRDSLVVVGLGASQPVSGVTTLHVEATAKGRTVTFDLHPVGDAGTVSIPPDQSFGIEVPHALSGRIDVRVTAQSSTAEPLASGAGSAEISVGGRVDLPIDLQPGGPDAGVDAGVPVDLAGADFAGADFALKPGVDGSSPPPDLLGPLCPSVMLVFDHSGSTGDLTVDGGVMKNLAERGALENVFLPLNDRMPIGLAHFGGVPNVMNDCASGAGVLLAPALNQSSALQTAMDGLMADGNSNNGSGLVYAAQTLEASAAPRAMIVVMLNDGPANCTSNGDGGNIMEPMYSVNQIALAHSLGVSVYVVAFGSGYVTADLPVLDQMATAGGVPCTTCGHQFYPGTTEADLTTTLTQIANQIVGSCTR